MRVPNISLVVAVLVYMFCSVVHAEKVGFVVSPDNAGTHGLTITVTDREGKLPSVSVTVSKETKFLEKLPDAYLVSDDFNLRLKVREDAKGHRVASFDLSRPLLEKSNLYVSTGELSKVNATYVITLRDFVEPEKEKKKP